MTDFEDALRTGLRRGGERAPGPSSPILAPESLVRIHRQRVGRDRAVLGIGVVAAGALVISVAAGGGLALPGNSSHPSASVGGGAPSPAVSTPAKTPDHRLPGLPPPLKTKATLPPDQSVQEIARMNLTRTWGAAVGPLAHDPSFVAAVQRRAVALFAKSVYDGVSVKSSDFRVLAAGDAKGTRAVLLAGPRQKDGEPWPLPLWLVGKVGAAASNLSSAPCIGNPALCPVPLDRSGGLARTMWSTGRFDRTTGAVIGGVIHGGPSGGYLVAGPAGTTVTVETKDLTATSPRARGVVATAEPVPGMPGVYQIPPTSRFLDDSYVVSRRNGEIVLWDVLEPVRGLDATFAP